jgi:hypothetical protein
LSFLIPTGKKQTKGQINKGHTIALPYHPTSTALTSRKELNEREATRTFPRN